MAEFPQGFFRSPRFAIPQNLMTGVSVEEERGGREGGYLFGTKWINLILFGLPFLIHRCQVNSISTPTHSPND